jgi:hypothetical protein
MIGQVSVAAATAVVGYDLFRDQTWRVSARSRRLRGLAVAGSAAAGDTAVDLYVDQHWVGRFYNLATGWPTMDHMVPLKGNYVPPGATVACIVADAPLTNPINIILE